MLIGALFLCLQASGTGERLLLADRSEVEGELQGCTAQGTLRVRLASGLVREIPQEELVRIRFGPEAAGSSAPRSPERVQLAHGGVIHGRLESLDERGAVILGTCGKVLLRPEMLRVILLSASSLPLPELKSGSTDVLVLETGGEGEGQPPRREIALEYGRLLSLGARVSFQSESGEMKLFERAVVKRILLRSRETGVELPPGLYVRVKLKDGSSWLGVIEAASAGAVKIFSHVTGGVEVPKAQLRSLAFVTQARIGVGNLLIGESTGLREFDRQGRELWSYRGGDREVRIGRRLENGNILMVCPHSGQVLEVRPRGKSESDLIWSLNEVNYPYDALRLPGGNTLVAEHHAGRIAEYDPSRKCIRSFQVQLPQSLQRLDNGNILVTSTSAVFELDRDWKEVWSAQLKGQLRPWRAERLENGNTLITDHQRGLVVELDGASNEVWRHGGLSRPVQALRLEDGNTLILEQMPGRLIEVDPAAPGRQHPLIQGLQGASSVTQS